VHPHQSRRVTAVVAEHRDRSRPVVTRHCGHEFRVSPTVFSPFIAPSGLLTCAIAGLPIFKDKRVLDIGCGAGIFTTLAATSGAKRVVGTDINPDAIADAQHNAKQAGVSDVVQVHEGHLFEPVHASMKFDIVLADLPFADGSPEDVLDRAFYDAGLQTLLEFVREVPRWLSNGGSAYFCHSNLQEVDFYRVLWDASRPPQSTEFITIRNHEWVELFVTRISLDGG